MSEAKSANEIDDPLVAVPIPEQVAAQEGFTALPGRSGNLRRSLPFVLLRAVGLFQPQSDRFYHALITRAVG
jgi:hypothetical protein